MINTKLNDLIRKTNQTDPVVHSALTALLEGGPFPMKSNLKDWHTANELVFYKNRCYVPDDLTLRCNVVLKYHNTISAGHPGRLATHILVQRDYWWPGMATFIQNYVDSCAICQQHKISCHPICPLLQPISPEKQQLFSLITMDFITDLPPVRGRSTSSDVFSDISPSPLYIPPHRRQPKTECTRGSDTGVR